MPTPITVTARVVAASATLERLRKNGTRRVRMAKTISVCVTNDSTK
jgi:hypothetical protein